MHTYMHTFRLYGCEPQTPLKNLKAPLFGKCVTVSGTVVRVSSIKPLVTQLAFQCAVCQEINVSRHTDISVV